MRLALPPISCKVPTPVDLAEAIVRAVGDTPNASWLEPSHGTGVFLRAMVDFGIPRARLVAVDLDPLSYPSDDLAETYRGTDFLRWATTTSYRFDRIVGNPPYISIKRLRPSLRGTASKVVGPDGNPIGLNANVWYAFILSSLHLLKVGGTLAFVLPSAAEFANYSEALRQKIGSLFGEVVLHRCTRSLFENVQEGTLVAIARDYQAGTGRITKKVYQTRASLIKGLAGGGNRVRQICVPRPKPNANRTLKFSSVASIRLGGVTGHASYFLMNEDRRNELRLPTEAMTRVVSKARHLRSDRIDRAVWRSLCDQGERVWLFNPTPASRTNREVARYLRRKVENGGCNKDAYKVSSRTPWYTTPLPEVADAFVSGMNQGGPWLSMNGMKDLSATNTLYVIAFNDRDPNVWYKYALALLTSFTRRRLSRVARRYADGLIKFEPGAIGMIELPIMDIGANHKVLYKKAVAKLVVGLTREASDIADSARA